MKLASRWTFYVCILATAAITQGLPMWKIAIAIFIVGIANVAGYVEQSYDVLAERTR